MESDKAPLRSRRGLLKFAVAAGGVAAASLAAAWGMVRNLLPSVSYGQDPRVKVGTKGDFADGQTVLFDEKLTVVKETDEAGRVRVAAISMICTHLGCTVSSAAGGFRCPCHGSRYDREGRVTGGPAPKDLPWFEVYADPSGQLVVDQGRTHPVDTYFEV